MRLAKKAKPLLAKLLPIDFGSVAACVKFIGFSWSLASSWSTCIPDSTWDSFAFPKSVLPTCTQAHKIASAHATTYASQK
ncbi:hypothetical protein EVAR_72221_1 [Eumeta japonica]|uniref:Uncharacterized protein n=1 Tax=Eumeta variegata TaxID=151549 RepID=A0A4C1SUS1_EUMVA|nr:hypothetical protein EVAR_72221_1 [Eumeta japonica]